MVEWDESKRLANLAKHGIDFDDAVHIFQGLVLETTDDRRNYGERRVKALGMTQGQILCVVYTVRGERRRIISARRANRNERENYRSTQVAQRPD